MKGTAWELLLLVEDIWGKQGCILCLLIKTDLPWRAWKQSCRRSDQKEPEGEIKENGSCQAFPLAPPGQERRLLLPRGTPACIFHRLLPSWCRKDRPSPCDHRCYQHGAWWGCRSRHLCPNSLGSVGLGFHFSPTLLPLSGYKPVLLDETMRNSHYKTIFAMLVLDPHFHSSNFYWVSYLWWAGWYFLQKLVQFILKFCMFLHRKAYTMIYRQLGHNQTMLQTCSFVSVRFTPCRSPRMPFNDMWLHEVTGSFLVLLWAAWSATSTKPSLGKDYKSQHADSHPASLRFWMQEKTKHKHALHKDTSWGIIVSYSMPLCEEDTTEINLTPNSIYLWSYSETAHFVKAASIS